MTFPLRILLEIKTKIHTLKFPVIIHHQTQKQKAMQRLKFVGVRRCQRQSKADLNWIKLSSCRTDQITENILRLAVFSCFRKKKQRALNTDWEKNCYCHHESDLKIIHHEKLLRLILSDSHSSTFSDLINQWLLWKLCYAFIKEKDKDLKKNKKATFAVVLMKFLLNFQEQKTT